MPDVRIDQQECRRLTAALLAQIPRSGSDSDRVNAIAALTAACAAYYAEIAETDVAGIVAISEIPAVILALYVRARELQSKGQSVRDLDAANGRTIQ